MLMMKLLLVPVPHYDGFDLFGERDEIAGSREVSVLCRNNEADRLTWVDKAVETGNRRGTSAGF